MKEKIALFGAGGKMGVRLAKNLKKSDYVVAHVEVSEVGQKRLKDEVGIDCVSIDAALEDDWAAMVERSCTPQTSRRSSPPTLTARASTLLSRRRRQTLRGLRVALSLWWCARRWRTRV